MTLAGSRYFHPEELSSHDGIAYPVEWADRLAALLSQLDVIRGAWGGPLRVVSGYRSPAHNAAVGGAQASQHMEGRAADISPLVSSLAMPEMCADLHGRILRLIELGRLPLVGGLGVYAGWVHCDIRPKPPSGHIAQWRGTGVGSEVT